MTSASRPLNKYLSLQVKADREVLALLRSMQRDTEVMLRGLPKSGVGAIVRREQLRLAQRAIEDSINATWLKLSDIIERQSLVAASDAVLVNGEFDRVLVRAGLSGAQIAALTASNIAQSQQAVRHALNRHFDETGAQKIPLSKKVYESRQLVKGQVDRLVESALARGLSATEFAKEATKFIRPDTPGGVRYAALRLSRTEINNAFHYAQTRDSAAKPWVTGQKWHLSGSHPTPDECNDFAEQNRFDLGQGVFPKGDVPAKPHPHCLCYIEPIADSEAEWLRKFQKGEYNDYLDSRMPVGLPQKTSSSIFASQKQIDDFVRASKFKKAFKHVSDEKNAESIAKNGLRTGEGQANGAKYGNGVYAAADNMTAKAYERGTGVDGLKNKKTITYDVYVRVKKPFDINVGDVKTRGLLNRDGGFGRLVRQVNPEKYDALQDKYLKQFHDWQKMALSPKYFGKSEELLEKATRDRFGTSVKGMQSPRERAIRAFLEAEGYDSVYIHGLKNWNAPIGGNQILVFDEKNVIISNPVTRKGK